MRWARRLNRHRSSDAERHELDRIAALEDPDELAAALEPERVGPDGSVWLDRIGSEVTWRLVELGTANARSALEKLTEHPHADVREFAEWRVSEIRDRER